MQIQADALQTLEMQAKHQADELAVAEEQLAAKTDQCQASAYSCCFALSADMAIAPADLLAVRASSISNCMYVRMPLCARMLHGAHQYGFFLASAERLSQWLDRTQSRCSLQLLKWHHDDDIAWDYLCHEAQ